MCPHSTETDQASGGNEPKGSTDRIRVTARGEECKAPLEAPAAPPETRKLRGMAPGMLTVLQGHGPS